MTMPEGDLQRLIHPERAKLIPVSGANDQPEMDAAVDVQFNPATLKVSLSNTLRENPRGGNSRSAQFVDKSSSSLAVELIFDTTHIDSQAEAIYRERAQAEGRDRQAVAPGSDVRLLTKPIAETFCKPVESGDQMQAPQRCLFQWGAFEFLGMVDSFDETLDFFSPEGRPLRATVALKLSEARYQFRNRDVEQAERATPTLSPTGNRSDEGSGQDAAPVQSGAAGKPQDWRDTALYNGIENPRLPAASVLATPSVSLGASVGIGVGMGAGVSAGASVSAAAGIGIGAGTHIQATPPAFRFGASGTLGTGIEGAFGAGLSAGGIASGGASLRAGGSGSDKKPGGGFFAGVKGGGGVGFD